MKRILAFSLSAALLTACSGDVSPTGMDAKFGRDGDPTLSVGGGAIAIVTHDDDSGKGSLRAAVEQANADPAIRRIEIKPAARTIRLQSSVVYTGAQARTIIGKNTVIDASNANGSALVAIGGSSLTVESLTLRGANGQGLEVQVPAAATGVISIVLRDVTVEDNTGHGLLINDQVETETTDGVQPNANGSDASLAVTIENSRFLRNGYSVSDRDGVRINEGGVGSLDFTARNVRSEDNAADGIELDERGTGDVRIDVADTFILRNGKFDPTDFDDGFDIDEYDAGGIIGTMVRTTASDNFEEGLDFNENNAGDLLVDLTDVVANGNDEEGIDYEEDDDFAGGGNLLTTMVRVTANRNGGDGGLKIREKGVGDLLANVTTVEASGNVVSGIFIREDAAGNLSSSISNAQTRANGAHGIDFDENSTGNLTASVSQSVSTTNTLYGLRADQQTTGTGTLRLTNVALSGNVTGTTTGNVAPTIVP